MRDFYQKQKSIELENSIYKEVLESYPNYFNITKVVLKKIEDRMNLQFTEDEISFLVIHFKAAIDRNKVKSKKKRVALKKPINKLIVGTLKPILGYIMLGAGADFIVQNLDYLAKMIEKGFNITGVVPNNEAIVSIAQKVLGKETMFILLAGLIINILI